MWTKQVKHVLSWIIALLQGPLVRDYLLSVYTGSGNNVEICLDASPWGIGGTLALNGKLKTWFCDQLQLTDIKTLGIVVGSCTCQQIVEALAVLVALRLWSDEWLRDGATLRK